MKKVNKNLIVFIIVIVLIALGLVSPNMFKSIVSASKTAVYDAKTSGLFNSISNYTKSIEKATDENSYHDRCLDLNSMFLNFTNKRVVDKEGVIIYKTKSGNLGWTNGYESDENIDFVTDKIVELRDYAESRGAGFLYVQAPHKGYEFEMPENVKDYTKENVDRLSQTLEDKNIPHLNVIEEMKQENMYSEDVFFTTDHHWRPLYGFWTAGKICEYLGDNYGFDYNKEYADLNSYNVVTYEKWFLGSQGKKVGAYFTSKGPDDFELITPKFETNLTQSQPIKNETVTGSFEESVLFMKNILTKDYYNLTVYDTYSGGDFRLEIIKNNLNPNGKKILIIKDSYAGVVNPFLSLQAGELHILDIRDSEGFVGDKLDVYDYIDEISPDYVLVLYNVSLYDSKFDFGKLG